VYFRYMEQARISWFDRLVPEDDAWRSTGVVIANATCNYRRAITYPGMVEVKLFAGAPGGASVPTYYELRVDADAVPYADGAAMVVFIDMKTQKSKRIPEAIRARLERAEAAA
jgi:acyl-CoA thioester hydrolase